MLEGQVVNELKEYLPEASDHQVVEGVSNEDEYIHQLFSTESKVLLVNLMIAVTNTNKKLVSIEKNLSTINRKQTELVITVMPFKS